ncbi:hypothetical protein [Microbulbifer sp. 2205BS26-8]|uniref:hypothetical protein n=1 Tax=Microbulbifer sp. 2205BS26-8 TaxID=3064386 RepID=UPI00273F4545|nr:hypothetical protein [Microbulbifer sp. 2205BS26-8]MDP5208971.1 hypothetical protein [Microbulbifer sp. 2205BS26-8]
MQQIIPFQACWLWLTEHSDCILRAGSIDTVVYDDDHWCFTEEDACRLLVQVLRGKRPMTELFIEPAHIALVRMAPGESGAFNFNLFRNPNSRR